MYRDQKVGLALSVLLVGIVGALFFRNEGPRPAEPPRLNNEQKLNAAIADGDTVPYLTGLEPVKSGADRDTQSSPSDGTGSEWEVPDFLKDGHSNQENQSRAPAPGPIGVVQNQPPSTRHNNAIAIPRSNNAWETAGNNAASKQSSSKNGHVLLHQVAKGENLSNLAKKYLGDSSRFNEIFEANTDLLKSADDLQVGMKLRIPVGDRNKSTGVANNKTRSQPNRTANSDLTDSETNSGRKVKSRTVSQQSKTDPSADKGKNKRGRFVPVDRSPLAPGLGGRHGKASDAKSSSGRKSLSQLPPPDFNPLELSETARSQESPRRPGTADKKNSPADSSKGKVQNSRPRRYTVRRGDSLERISIRFFGNNKSSRKIFDANRAVLKNPNAIREGMTLIIP